jgi:hypothetical protein
MTTTSETTLAGEVSQHDSPQAALVECDASSASGGVIRRVTRFFASAAAAEAAKLALDQNSPPHIRHEVQALRVTPRLTARGKRRR